MPPTTIRMSSLLFWNVFKCNPLLSLREILEDCPSPQQLLSTVISLFEMTLPRRYQAVDISRSPMEFDVDHDTGFLPPRALPRLPEKYAIWEQWLALAPERLSLGEDDSEPAMQKRASSEAWRSQIKSWPVLDTAELETDERYLKRAHLVLAWLVHYFVHSMPPAEDMMAAIHVPETLAVPLVQVSRLLGIAPVLTYADTVLWNWEMVNENRPVTLDNIRFQNNFSGTEDERSFYNMSIQVEFQGIELLRIIDEYNHLPNLTSLTSISKISRDLVRIKWLVDDMVEILQSVRPVCDPHVFYWGVRPWFEGADALGPLSAGWVYDGVPDSHSLDLSGPSAGQSSTMHALDIFLDIDHKLRHKRFPAPSAENRKADVGFMARMRRYMPEKHRSYLEHLEATPRSLRELVQNTPTLREPYNNVVAALKHLRDLHMRTACLYIVTMSKTSGSRSGCPASAMIERLQAARNAGEGPVRGTGGTSLSLLLKASRDATRRAMLKDN